MTELLAKNLTDWRRRLIVRDCEMVAVVGDKPVRRGRCCLCWGQFDLPSLQAHHVWPKAIYPAWSLYLNNGVMLCTGCHLGIVHRGNPALDISTWQNWMRFTGFFEEYLESFYDDACLSRTPVMPRRGSILRTSGDS